MTVRAGAPTSLGLISCHHTHMPDSKMLSKLADCSNEDPTQPLKYCTTKLHYIKILDYNATVNYTIPSDYATTQRSPTRHYIIFNLFTLLNYTTVKYCIPQLSNTILK